MTQNSTETNAEPDEATDSYPDFSTAVAATSAVVSGIHDDQLIDPTPSTDYAVGDLIEHLDGLSKGLQLTARKTAPPSGDPELRDGDATHLTTGWRQRIPGQLHGLSLAWAEPAAWNGETLTGGIPLPAAVAGMFALNEVIIHGWELATSTHQPYDTDDTATEACIAFLHNQPRNDELFAPPVHVPQQAPAIHRLIGFTGRDPNWHPS